VPSVKISDFGLRIWGGAAFWHHPRQLSNQQRRIADEGDNPTAPSEIVIRSRQIVGHQIEFVNFQVWE